MSWPDGVFSLYKISDLVNEKSFVKVKIDSLVKSLFTRHCEEQSDEAIS